MRTSLVRRRGPGTLLVLGLAAVLAAGCGSSGSSGTSSTGSPAPTGSSSPAVTASPDATVVWPGATPVATPGTPVGLWVTRHPVPDGDYVVLAMAGDGTYSIAGGSSPASLSEPMTGRYRRSAETLTLLTWPLCKATGQSELGTYRWLIKHEALVLEATADPCDVRSHLLDGATFTSLLPTGV
jgi:hypothetical protein